jgi:hemin uptake protein HemP
MPTSAPGTPPDLPVEQRPVPAKTTVKQDILLSSALLGPRQSIEIEHNGQRYRLQSTKSGKLILTK